MIYLLHGEYDVAKASAFCCSRLGDDEALFDGPHRAKRRLQLRGRARIRQIAHEDLGHLRKAVRDRTWLSGTCVTLFECERGGLQTQAPLLLAIRYAQHRQQ